MEKGINIGRVQNRIFLAEKAQYEWLIYLDVDSEPKKNDYLKKYISKIGSSDFIFGGNEFKYNRIKSYDSTIRYKGEIRLSFRPNKSLSS